MKPRKCIPPLSDQDIQRFWGRVAVGESDACWPAKRPTNHPYSNFSIGRAVHIPAHRVAYFIHYGVDPNDQLVCHSCDNPPCCNPAHLFLGDYKVNKLDCRSKGRHAHKLTSAEVFTIRRCLSEGTTYRALGRQFGVEHSSIQAIAENRVWKDISYPKGRINVFGKDRS